MNETNQDKDYKWFLDHYDELYKKYGTSYIAIKEKTVLGTYSSYQEAVDKTKETEQLGSFIVQLCNGDESAYTNYISSMNFAVN